MIEVVVARFAALLRAPTREEIAEAAGIGVDDVEAGLRALEADGTVELRDGEILRAGPFSAVPTEYVATVNGRRHFGTDALGAFGVVAALGGIGRVERGALRAECAIRRVSAPRDHVVHVSGGESHLFASREALDAWLGDRERGETMTVDDCWQLARSLVAGPFWQRS